MPDRKVAVTGVGIICAAGLNTKEAWNSLQRGIPAIGPITSVDTSTLRFHNAAEVRGYDPGAHFPGSQQDHLDRFAQFAVIAAREAFADSGATLTPELCERTAVVLGTGTGGQSTQDAGFEDLYLHRRGRVHPLIIPRAMVNAGASQVCMEFGATGPAFALSTACSSSNHAIGLAFQMVRRGDADLAFTGGSEAPFGLGLLKAWEAMRVMAPDIAGHSARIAAEWFSERAARCSFSSRSKPRKREAQKSTPKLPALECPRMRITSRNPRSPARRVPCAQP